MKIKNIEVDFDFLDADDAEKFENGAKEVIEKCKEKREQEMSYSQSIKEECQVIEEFFDKVFGEGISQSLFKGKKNLGEHITAFEDIVKAKIEKQKDLQTVYDRYKPNREQRRYNQFQKVKK